MAFSRKFLTDHGVPEDQVDAILAERNRTLGDYIPKADVQAQIDAAVATAREEASKGVNVEESEAYKTLQAELTKTKAIGSEAFAVIKPKFREAVYGLLDHEKDVAEQLPAIKEQYEEYFATEDPKPTNTPQYSRQVPPPSHEPTTEEDKLVGELLKNWK